VTTDADDLAPPRRAWPFGLAQSLVIVVLCAVVAGVIGWQLGARDDGESFSEVDAGFLEDMLFHHNGAIALGFDYLPNENDSVVGHLAREMIQVQAAEMALMNVLVADAGNPDIATNGVAMEWMGAPMNPGRMPGMATAGDLEALRASTGLEADDLFTRLMIRHHASGVAMAERAVAEGKNARVRRLADTMARQQQVEIDELNRRRVVLGLPEVDASDVVEAHDAHGH